MLRPAECYLCFFSIVTRSVEFFLGPNGDNDWFRFLCVCMPCRCANFVPMQLGVDALPVSNVHHKKLQRCLVFVGVEGELKSPGSNNAMTSFQCGSSECVCVCSFCWP